MSSRGEPLEIVLVSNGEFGSGAYESHVLGLGRWLSPHALVHHVALVSPRLYASPEGRELRARGEAHARKLISGEVRIVPHSPRQRLLGVDAWMLARAIDDVRRTTAPPLLHCRASLAVIAAASGTRRRVPGTVVLHDARGAIEHEAAAYGGFFEPSHVHWLEEQACRLADATIAVSHALAGYLAARHGVQAAGIFACAVDMKRFQPDVQARVERRRQLGLRDEFVLGFVGGLAGWQRPDALASLFLALREERPDARLLVITPQVEEYRREMLRSGLSSQSFDVLAARHDDVPSWIAACDATALLRNRDVINAVASPIKFGESLGMGVPVLLTEGIGDASEAVVREQLGTAFEDLFLGGLQDRARLRAFLRDQAQDGAALSRRCRAFAERHWSWDEQVPRLLELYHSLLGQHGASA